MDRAEEEEMVMLEVEAMGAPVMVRVPAVARVVAVDVPTVKAERREPYKFEIEVEARVRV